MTKTLYVSDLDGTLLNSNAEVSARTAATPNRLISDHGAMFTIATARTPATVVALMEHIDTRLPLIVMAGGAVWDNKARDYACVSTLDRGAAGSLLALFARHGINPFVYRHHGSQIHVHHVEAMTAAERRFIAPRIGTPYKRLFTDAALSADDPDDVMLMFAIGSFGKMRAMADDIDRCGVACSYNCYHDVDDPGTGLLDIYRPGTTKAAAIRRVADACGAGRIVVFGDNLNDISMRDVADRSVAVGNAFDEVKAAFDEVTGTNDEDAVARWIEHDMGLG